MKNTLESRIKVGKKCSYIELTDAEADRDFYHGCGSVAVASKNGDIRSLLYVDPECSDLNTASAADWLAEFDGCDMYMAYASTYCLYDIQPL